jgi:yecA family protein
MSGDFADVQELMGLLMRYWNSCAHDFEQETVQLAYVEENGVDGVQGRTWARGYMHGTRLVPEGWSRIFGDEREALLLMIPVAAGEVDPESPKEPLTPSATTSSCRTCSREPRAPTGISRRTASPPRWRPRGQNPTSALESEKPS